jgi:hypothetical protein
VEWVVLEFAFSITSVLVFWSKHFVQRAQLSVFLKDDFCACFVYVSVSVV